MDENDALPEFLRKEATLLKVSFIRSIRSLLLPFFGTNSSGVKDSNVNGYTTGISAKKYKRLQLTK